MFFHIFPLRLAAFHKTISSQKGCSVQNNNHNSANFKIYRLFSLISAGFAVVPLSPAPLETAFPTINQTGCSKKLPSPWAGISIAANLFPKYLWKGLSGKEAVLSGFLAGDRHALSPALPEESTIDTAPPFRRLYWDFHRHFCIYS